MPSSLTCPVALLALTLIGCADTQPKIEGRIHAVSAADIREVIALEQRRMVREFGHIVRIDSVDIVDHNGIWLTYRHGNDEISSSYQRIHGVWTPPRMAVRVW